MTPTTSAGASCSGANSKVTWATSGNSDLRWVRCRRMSAVTTPPFRADHVGSLLRPPELLQAREDFADDRDRRRRAARDRGRRDPRRRASCRRTSACSRPPTASSAARPGTWTSSTSSAASPRRPGNLKVKFHNAEGDIELTPAAMHVDGKVTLEKPIFADALRVPAGVRHERHAEADDPVAEHGPLPRRPRGDRRVGLPGHGRVLGRPDDRLRRPGRRRSATSAAPTCSSTTRASPTSTTPTSARRWRPRATTPSTCTRPTSATSTRRSPSAPRAWRSPPTCAAATSARSWVAEGGYDFVAEALFNELDVDGFFMEWDDARSGGFEPLRFVPKGKVVVLGLVTTKKGELETKDLLKRRIEEATQYVDLDQLCLSPQCGFSSTVEGNALTVDQEIDKLRLVVETARGGLGLDCARAHAPPAAARRGRGGGARRRADDAARLRAARRRARALARRRLPARGAGGGDGLGRLAGARDGAGERARVQLLPHPADRALHDRDRRELGRAGRVLPRGGAARRSLAEVARRRAVEAEQRRQEADLSAEMARLLLRGGRLEETLPAVGARLAQALGLASASIELRASRPASARRLRAARGHAPDRHARAARRARRRRCCGAIQMRIVPALEALLAAALERDALMAEVVETAALRRSDVIKTALLRSVSHDLRSPLTAILTTAEALRRRLTDDERVELAERRRATRRRRLSRLIDDLLDLSRLEADAAEPRPEWSLGRGGASRAAIEDLGLPPAPSRSRSTPTCRRCAPTPPSSSARSRTCSRTPSATPAATRSRCARATSAAASCSASSTAARASRRPSRSGSSSRSTARAPTDRPPRLRARAGDRARVRRGQRRPGLGRVAARPGDLVRGRATGAGALVNGHRYAASGAAHVRVASTHAPDHEDTLPRSRRRPAPDRRPPRPPAGGSRPSRLWTTRSISLMPMNGAIRPPTP